MFLKYFSEENNLLNQHAFTLSAIQDLLRKETLFDLPNSEQLRTIEKKPQHLLVTHIFQIHHTQNQFFENLI